MGFDKPQDLAWMFIIFASVVVTIGFGVSMVNTEYSAGVDNTLFNNMTTRIDSSTGLKGAADAQTGILNGDEGSTTDANTRDSFILQGFQSLRQLGNTWSAVQDSIDEGFGYLGIDPIYVTLIMAGITITFAAVMYSWLRGN